MNIKELLKSNKIIYKIAHSINLFRLKLNVFPYSIKYLFADRKPKIIINDSYSTHKYYIFRKVDYTGLMTHMLTVMGWIKYAKENGYELIVDTSCGENPYIEKSNENTWELFYSQPMYNGIIEQNTLESIIQEKNYAFVPDFTRYGLTYVRYVPRWLIKVFKPTILFPKANDFVRDEKSQLYWEKLYSEYIHFQPEIEEYVNDEYNRVLKDKGRILGVLIRGTAYRDGKPYNHHIQPEMDDLIKKIDEFKENYDWDYIYLATEEEKYEEILRNQYPGKILTNKRKYQQNGVVNTGHNAGLEYLSSMYLLSKCDMLVAGLCGGSQAALLMNQHKYEHVYLFDIGKYK